LTACHLAADLQDHIVLSKTGKNGTCAELSIATPAPSGATTQFHVTTPSRWVVTGSPKGGTCTDGGTSSKAIGALGTMALSPSGSTCALSAHVTLFFAADAGAALTSIRIDTDALTIAGGPSSVYCPQ
jgi:hypothetical protein